MGDNETEAEGSFADMMEGVNDWAQELARASGHHPEGFVQNVEAFYTAVQTRRLFKKVCPHSFFRECI